jgi:hypothetical protein
MLPSRGHELGIDTDNPPETLTFADSVEQRDMEIVAHREFANLNRIEYSLD